MIEGENGREKFLFLDIQVLLMKN